MRVRARAMRRSGAGKRTSGKEEQLHGKEVEPQGKEEEPRGKEKEPQGKQLPCMNPAFSRSCESPRKMQLAISGRLRPAASIPRGDAIVRSLWLMHELPPGSPWVLPNFRRAATTLLESPETTGSKQASRRSRPRLPRRRRLGGRQREEGWRVMRRSPARHNRLIEGTIARKPAFSKKMFSFVFLLLQIFLIYQTLAAADRRRIGRPLATAAQTKPKAACRTETLGDREPGLSILGVPSTPCAVTLPLSLQRRVR